MGANPIFAGIAGAAEEIAASIGMERPHHSRALEMVDELRLVSSLVVQSVHLIMFAILFRLSAIGFLCFELLF